MKEFIEKLIGRLEEKAGKAEQEMNYYRELSEEDASCEVFADSHEKEYEAYCGAIDIVNELAEEYMTCYKTCTECEAYDKEKHHCPKFCYIIAETVKEIEENHKGGWIPCSERLPEESHDYLICDDKGNVYSSTYHNNRWLVNFATDEVIAWQPLPESYKGE